MLRAEFVVLATFQGAVQHGLFAEPRIYPARIRFPGQARRRRRTFEDSRQCFVGPELMRVPGPRLMADEHFTQDPIPVSFRAA
jgi:hypothetical protein